jgi:hypothetical protein
LSLFIRRFPWVCEKDWKTDSRKHMKIFSGAWPSHCWKKGVHILLMWVRKWLHPAPNDNNSTVALLTWESTSSWRPCCLRSNKSSLHHNPISIYLAGSIFHEVHTTNFRINCERWKASVAIRARISVMTYLYYGGWPSLACTMPTHCAAGGLGRQFYAEMERKSLQSQPEGWVYKHWSQGYDIWLLSFVLCSCILHDS